MKACEVRGNGVATTSSAGKGHLRVNYRMPHRPLCVLPGLVEGPVEKPQKAADSGLFAGAGTAHDAHAKRTGVRSCINFAQQ